MEKINLEKFNHGIHKVNDDIYVCTLNIFLHDEFGIYVGNKTVDEIINDRIKTLNKCNDLSDLFEYKNMVTKILWNFKSHNFTNENVLFIISSDGYNEKYIMYSLETFKIYSFGLLDCNLNEYKCDFGWMLHSLFNECIKHHINRG